VVGHHDQLGLRVFNYQSWLNKHHSVQEVLVENILGELGEVVVVQLDGSAGVGAEEPEHNGEGQDGGEGPRGDRTDLSLSTHSTHVRALSLVKYICVNCKEERFSVYRHPTLKMGCPCVRVSVFPSVPRKKVLHDREVGSIFFYHLLRLAKLTRESEKKTHFFFFELTFFRKKSFLWVMARAAAGGGGDPQ
jgi:hypothetical protein